LRTDARVDFVCIERSAVEQLAGRRFGALGGAFHQIDALIGQNALEPELCSGLPKKRDSAALMYLSVTINKTPCFSY
jgi:hypothetical protein